jgi:hypothetical protein
VFLRIKRQSVMWVIFFSIHVSVIPELLHMIFDRFFTHIGRGH